MTLELARALYFRELDAKAQNDTRVGVFSALLSAIGGALAFVISRGWPAQTLWLSVSLGLSAFAAAVFLVAVVWVLRSLVGFQYAYLPSADALLSHWRGLSAYFASNPSAGTAREDFDEELLVRLSSATSQNSANNRVRSARLYFGAQLLLVVVLLLAGAATSLAVNAVALATLPTGGSTMANNPKPSQPTTRPVAPTAPPAPAPSVKPVMPQNVIQKGGAERPTPRSGQGR